MATFWLEVRLYCPSGSPFEMDGCSVLGGPVVKNDPADRHGHQEQAGEKQQQPGEHAPDAGLWG
jgi:hypothetical protein